jgi:hypothetical protein
MTPSRLIVASLALTVGAFLAGCAHSAPAGSTSTASLPDSGIQGRTMVDAGSPMVYGRTPSPDRPLSARLTVTGEHDARSVAEATSDADGRFRIPLPPGTYVLHPANLTGSVVPAATPMTVTVAPGAFTSVTVSFDSGVR